MMTVILAFHDKEQVRQILAAKEILNQTFLITGIYADGVKVMEEIIRQHPDLVLLEQNLPGMKGLEIIKNARRHAVSTDFVLLERNKNFDLAQAAMRMGVEEYLISPASDEELERIFAKYADHRQARAEKGRKNDLLLTRRLLRNAFMRDFVTQENAGELSISDLNSRYCFAFHNGIFQAAFIQLLGLPEKMETSFLPGLVAELRYRFDPICHEMVPYIDGARRLTLIFNYSKDSGTSKRLSGLLEIVQDHAQKAGCPECSCTIGIGRPADHASELGHSLHTAQQAAFCGVLRGYNRQYVSSRLTFEPLRPEQICTPQWIRDLKTSATYMDVRKFKDLIQQAMDSVTPRSDPEIPLSIFRESIRSVLQICDKPEQEIQEETQVVLAMLGENDSLQSLLRSFFDWVEHQFDEIRRQRLYSRPIRDAQNFIRENCSRRITLQDTANQVHLNASYLSTLFKKETGQNFSEFLTECRINEAKQMLRESSLSVEQICYEVGYTDKKHFSRLFIKNVGVKPSTYRILHS